MACWSLVRVSQNTINHTWNWTNSKKSGWVLLNIFIVNISANPLCLIFDVTIFTLCLAKRQNAHTSYSNINTTHQVLDVIVKTKFPKLMDVFCIRTASPPNLHVVPSQ